MGRNEIPACVEVPDRLEQELLLLKCSELVSRYMTERKCVEDISGGVLCRRQSLRDIGPVYVVLKKAGSERSIGDKKAVCVRVLDRFLLGKLAE